jgi:hypothetical protein
MGLCDAAKALAEGQRAARSLTPESGRAQERALRVGILPRASIRSRGVQAMNERSSEISASVRTSAETR